jgi:hypothetical protein
MADVPVMMNEMMDKVLHLRGEQKSVGEIAKELSLKPQFVSGLLASLGQPVKRGPITGRSSWHDQAKYAAIAEDYTAGKSLKQIAKKRKMSVEGVRRALNTQGVPRRPRGRPKTAPTE